MGDEVKIEAVQTPAAGVAQASDGDAAGRRSPGWRMEIVRPKVEADDPLLAFSAERPIPAQANPPTSETMWSLKSTWLPTIVAAAVVLGTGAIGYRTYASREATPNASGALRIMSQPSGASVAIDGAQKGVTPLALTLPSGEHRVEIRTAAATRAVNVTIVAGAESSQYFDFSSSTQPSTGDLEVSTDPRGASVIVDGAKRGTTPLRLNDLAPGVHQVVLTSGGKSISRHIMVYAGATATLLVPIETATSAPSGWIRISSPVVMRLYEDGRLLGTTETDRIMLPVGEHDIVIVNEVLAYNSKASLRVVAGKTTTHALTLPQGTLHVNAVPWAEVWIDGQRRGDTPLGNVSLPIGSHEVLFRHPQLGERRSTVVIALSEPTRVTVNFEE